MNETLSLIKSRRSHRAYEATPLTGEQLQALLDAAIQSPTAANRQPWHFTAVQNQALLADINEAARENVNSRAETMRSPRFLDPNYTIFYHAPTVIFISASAESGFAPVDCGIAVQNIALAAESLGLGSVILGLPREAFAGRRAQEIKRALKFPENYDFVIAIAVGIPTDTKEPPTIAGNKITVID